MRRGSDRRGRLQARSRRVRQAAGAGGGRDRACRSEQAQPGRRRGRRPRDPRRVIDEKRRGDAVARLRDLFVSSTPPRRGHEDHLLLPAAPQGRQEGHGRGRGPQGGSFAGALGTGFPSSSPRPATRRTGRPADTDPQRGSPGRAPGRPSALRSGTTMWRRLAGRGWPDGCRLAPGLPPEISHEADTAQDAGPRGSRCR